MPHVRLTTMKTLRLLLCTLCGLFTVAAQAADPVQKVYQINMIVFQMADNSGLSSEIWPSSPPQPNFAQATDLAAPSLLSSSTYQVLSAKQFGMTNALTKLQNSGKYKVITSLAWQQPLTSKADAKLLHIFAGQAYDASGNPLTNPSVTPPQDSSSTAAANGQTPAKWQLNGTVKVWLDTYVVIDTDFLLTENVPVMNSDAGDTSSHNQLMSFALNETVRARSNEINYMDNPIYGIIVLVSPAA